ncbi:MAG: recombinase family protein [Oscillospiraceae bacterium]|nr:recombinase family protein [Oscillospiraceae bacterium]
MVALYIRLSRLDDNLDERKLESNSVENQRKLLNEFISESPDLRTDDIEEFVDDGFSGTSFQRPAFQRMLGLIKKRTVTTVVVKDFSRFGRNYVECADYIEKLLPFLGTRFISVSDNYDSGKCEDNGIDVAMKNIVNSYYSQDLSRKVMSTFDLKRENGEFFFAAPFGYLRDENRPGKIVIDEEAARVVSHIFDLACDGRRLSDIARQLNQEKIPTIARYNREHKIKGKANSPEKSDFAAWTGTKVASILKNEVYTGTYIYRKRKRLLTGSKKRVNVGNPKKIPGNHPAIVDCETFYLAQEIFTGTRKKPAENRRYQLKSKVFCGRCGYAMAYQENVCDECFFFCNHSRNTGSDVGCPGEHFSEEILNERVFLRLRQWLSFLETACGKAEESERNRRECLNLLGEEAARLQFSLEACEREKLRFYESYVGGEISREEFFLEKQKLNSEIESLKSELSAIREKESTVRRLRNRHQPELDDLMSDVRLFRNEPKLTRKMAEVFIDKVTLYGKWQLEIDWVGEEAVDSLI